MEGRYFNRTYSARESYWILFQGLRTMKHLVKAKKNGAMSPEFVERIMLAVTEVNGCEVCSYAHTRMALELGMSREEVQTLLAGGTGRVPAEEAIAIAFAQHYADARGRPSRESWQRLVETYGSATARGILGAARAMMIGNAYGIAWSAFLRRLKGRPVETSSVCYELSMLPAVVFFPFAGLQALVSGLFRVPIIGFGPQPAA
jgi:AhpD family alkylhydroperoxidase